MALLDAIETPEVEPERQENRRRRYSHDEAIALAKVWERETGAPPTKREWDPASQRSTIRKLLVRVERLQDSVERFAGGGYPAAVTICNLFGSWDAFIHACGWEPRGQGRPPIQATPEPPPTPSADQLARGAGTHLDERRREQLRARSDGAGPSILAARIRSVIIAQKDGDPDWLAGELEALAAVAVDWCDRLRARRTDTERT